jgi:hypothetical protein
MRLEATVPDSHGSALVELADELGLSRSQIVDEAIGLFIKAIMEVRRGRRLVTVDPAGTEPQCELSTPTLATLEWANKPGKLTLSTDAFTKLAELTATPAMPNAHLKAAAKRHC